MKPLRGRVFVLFAFGTALSFGSEHVVATRGFYANLGLFYTALSVWFAFRESATGREFLGSCFFAFYLALMGWYGEIVAMTALRQIAQAA